MDNEELDFQKLYTEFHPRIFRYLVGLVGEFDAEDLAQAVFIKVNQALSTFRGESRISTWIYRIATNAAYDRLRQSSFRLTASQDPNDDTDFDEVVDQDLWSSESIPSIETSLHNKQRDECFCSFIESLPENYRLVVALSQLEDFTAREIAEILGLSVDVVKIRLHRGRVKLLEELKTRCKPEDWL
jgi:RNA polymerase sigma-70 factor (ECF subfamily)